MVTHDLPYALRAVPAVGHPLGRRHRRRRTDRDVLSDAELMAAHRLELPFGFDPSLTR